MMHYSTKDEIIRYLISAEGQPLSGQFLADELQMSRTAIWKQIQRLQEEGYVIETVKKRGYILTTQPEKLTQARIDPLLNTKELGRHLYLYDEIASTQVIAHELVAQNTPHGTIVLAEAQTNGRGRMLREWNSAKGKGLWMTCILRPEIPPHLAPQFTLVAAVAIVNAIKSLYPQVNAQIKWPNDILINGRKCTGILTEMVAETDQIRALLIGIGINVNQSMQDFPEELQSIATSLALECGVDKLDRAELLAEILLYLENYSVMYVKNGFSVIKRLWEQASCTIGNQVKATTMREVIEGVAIGITDSGVLEIKKADGTIASVYSADIELL